jgi:hypothetical protein
MGRKAVWSLCGLFNLYWIIEDAGLQNSHESWLEVNLNATTRVIIFQIRSGKGQIEADAIYSCQNVNS